MLSGGAGPFLDDERRDAAGGGLLTAAAHGDRSRRGVVGGLGASRRSPARADRVGAPWAPASADGDPGFGRYGGHPDDTDRGADGQGVGGQGAGGAEGVGEADGSRVPFAPDRPDGAEVPARRGRSRFGAGRRLRPAHLVALAALGLCVGVALRLGTHPRTASERSREPIAGAPTISAPAAGPVTDGSTVVTGPGPSPMGPVGAEPALDDDPGSTVPDPAGSTTVSLGPASVPTTAPGGPISSPTVTSPTPVPTTARPTTVPPPATTPVPATTTTTRPAPTTTAPPYTTGITRTRATNEPPWITNPGQIVTRVGTRVTYQLSVSAYPGEIITFSATGLPAGLSIDANTGTITGVPTRIETAGVQITARSNRGATATQGFTWVISFTF